MTDRLRRYELNYLPTWIRTAEATGGCRWVIEGRGEPAGVAEEIRSRGIRSLGTGSVKDLSFLRELPGLEFLWLDGVTDAGPVHELHALRLLEAIRWPGPLDLAAFPRLEWLALGGIGVRTLGAFADGHPVLWFVGLGGYPAEDVTALSRLELRWLKLGASSRLARLTGIEGFGRSLRRLELDRCAKLESLDALAALGQLEYVGLSNLPLITTLDWVRSLPRLRMLNVFDLRSVETLAPLAGHPTLEFVNFGRIRDLDLDPLLAIPNLKVFNTGHYRWNRDLRELPYFDTLPADSPSLGRWRELSIG